MLNYLRYLFLFDQPAIQRNYFLHRILQHQINKISVRYIMALLQCRTIVGRNGLWQESLWHNCLSLIRSGCEFTIHLPVYIAAYR
jgi:hypothetical protein